MSLPVFEIINVGFANVVQQHRQPQCRVGVNASHCNRRVCINVVNMMFVMLLKAYCRLYFGYYLPDNIGKIK